MHIYSIHLCKPQKKKEGGDVIIGERATLDMLVICRIFNCGDQRQQQQANEKCIIKIDTIKV